MRYTQIYFLWLENVLLLQAWIWQKNLKILFTPAVEKIFIFYLFIFYIYDEEAHRNISASPLLFIMQRDFI